MNLWSSLLKSLQNKNILSYKNEIEQTAARDTYNRILKIVGGCKFYEGFNFNI